MRGYNLSFVHGTPRNDATPSWKQQPSGTVQLLLGGADTSNTRLLEDCHFVDGDLPDAEVPSVYTFFVHTSMTM